MGELDRAGLTERDLVLERDGERPLRAEKNPCFFSINKTFVFFFFLFLVTLSLTIHSKRFSQRETA